MDREWTEQENRGLQIFMDGINKKCGNAFVVVAFDNRVVHVAMTLDYKYFHTAITLRTISDEENLGDTTKRCLLTLKEREEAEYGSIFDTVMTELAEELEALNAFDRAEYIIEDEDMADA